MTIFSRNALLLSFLATGLSAFGLLGWWGIDGEAAARVQFGVTELVLMLLLIANGFAIKRWVFRQPSSLLAQQLSWLCLLSLTLCFAGDVVNRNFAQLFYQHGPVVKHDYLADSVMFFAPGYLLLLVAVWRVATARGVSLRFMGLTSAVAATLGGLSFLNMADFNAGQRVLLITGGYAMLITVVGFSSLWLLKAYGAATAPASIRWVALGLALAAVADALIGSLWIYGNNGEGFFPAVSYVNWIVYFASQAMVQQLPLAVEKAA
jgi:hypothetical protein